jgi:hypothetical protein
VLAASSALAFTLLAVWSTRAATPQESGGVPKDQTYLGTKQCASCHFEQYVDWKKSKHSKAFDLLTPKYREDASCLKCHTTGFGQPTGYKDATTTALQGTSCEACHGPGSKHAEICKPLANKKKLTKEEEQVARGSIHRVLPANLCVTCHTARGHKAHPKYDKE